MKNLPMIEVPETARFRTINIDGEKGKGNITAVTVRSDDKFECQFYFCSPEDIKSYSKKMGHTIALLRLNADPIIFHPEAGNSVSKEVKRLAISEANRQDIHWLRDITVEDLR